MVYIKMKEIDINYHLYYKSNNIISIEDLVLENKN